LVGEDVIALASSAWLLDYDGTAFRTFTPPAGGVDVEGAYEKAVSEVFGDRALGRYRATGGLQNRAPIEVVRSLRPGAKPGELREGTDKLVKAKMAVLMGQVGLHSDGTIWPQPCAGFVSFWHELSRYVAAGRLHTGIISSGHEPFISRTWRLYGLRPPSVIVSDDDARAMATERDAEQWVKPGILPWRLALRRLADLDGGFRPKAAALKYFGDNSAKDGGMAAAAGVWYGHFDPKCQPRLTVYGAEFPDWSWVTEQLPRWLGRL
jgi:hypothetical protein